MAKFVQDISYAAEKQAVSVIADQIMKKLREFELDKEEEKNQLVQENVANQNLYYPRNVKEEYFQDNKSKFWKFIDVLFNL